jgi:hypothetical protein
MTPIPCLNSCIGPQWPNVVGIKLPVQTSCRSRRHSEKCSGRRCRSQQKRTWRDGWKSRQSSVRPGMTRRKSKITKSGSGEWDLLHWLISVNSAFTAERVCGASHGEPCIAAWCTAAVDTTLQTTSPVRHYTAHSFTFVGCCLLVLMGGSCRQECWLLRWEMRSRRVLQILHSGNREWEVSIQRGCVSGGA